MIVSCPSCQRNYVVADEQIAGKQFRARCKSCGVEFRLDGMPSRDSAVDASAAGEPAKFMSATEAFLALQTAPPPSNANWSVCLSQTDTRRMSTAEVAQAVAKGTINTGMFVWKNGMANWVRLSDVPELMTAIGKGGARVSPSGTGAAPAHSTVPSKPAPPMRSSTLMGGVVVPSQPAVSSASSSLSARSGQTMPPPPVMPDANQPPPVPIRQNSARPQQAPNVGVASVAPEKAPTVIRRNTPSPPRRATLDIPVEVDMSPPRAPTIEGATTVVAAVTAPSATPVPKALENPIQTANVEAPAVPAGGVLLPPLKGAEAAAVPTAAAAAIVAAAAAQAQPKPAIAESKPEQSAIDATSASSNSSRSSQFPEPKAKSKRFAGVVVAMASIGLFGVFGGIAGAVYYMKSMNKAAPQVSVVSAVALQPQAAMPGSVAPSASANAVPSSTTPAATPSSAPSGPADVLDGDVLAATSQSAVGDKPKSTGRGTPTGTGTLRPAIPIAAAPAMAIAPAPATKANGKATEPKPAPDLPSLPPAPESGASKPAAASGGAPFNRDAAMAVLGLAASRAPSCKKADGPTGTAKVYVTFDPNGTVVIANVVGSPIAGTPVAQCVAGIFRRIKVPPFSGDRASLSKDINIPP